MKFDVKWFFILTAVTGVICIPSHFDASIGKCGCRMMRPCYAKMLDELREQDEERCLEPVEMGTSTMMVYLKALSQYCGGVVNVTTDHLSHESRYLYEVHIHLPKEEGKIDYENVPMMLIDAGQAGGQESVQIAMRIIEHIVACVEHETMLTNFRWVFLPCVNPDGLEYVRFDRPTWRKNTRKLAGISYGIDITRNFDVHWEDCPKNTNGFSRRYPGPAPASESETRFVKDVIAKHKDYIRAYISLRRDGHGILYPHGYTDKSDDVTQRTKKVAELISQKVNQRGDYLQTFINTSIYTWKGEPVCGHSVDYVFNMGIELAFEMQVGFDRELKIIQQFQELPAGYNNNLISAYFSGIKELSNIVATQFESERKERELT